MAQRALTGRTQAPKAGRTAVSGCLALASMSMAGASAAQFRRRGTTVEPFHPERASALVITGVNSVSRNPMYVGMAGVLVAHALWRTSWVALIPVAGFVVLIDRAQIAAEETALGQRFGSEYEAYCASTPRWLDRRSLARAVDMLVPSWRPTTA
ncbi:MAG TPA: isoprenylcysteine carboxylmethyltransferase family protein [Nocardioides sp.]|uniref:methyltransferase family protein n=1 Tax=Nocardioides sp. TaxID=35761 RepID=UPI002D7EB480|nr:isoprenylcysteine carboxylmethyltransferase family protein [Nocardioides sp.]HET6653218.1 isoprenylcysteine carboxylmethyltransferase family protein [Nocardioides sp.]